MTPAHKDLPGPPRPLWRDRDFGVFWTAQTLSVVGDSFALVAVPLLVLHATGSVAQMGLLTGAAGAALVVSGVFAGVLVDRLDRRTLLIVCDLARMALYGLIPLVWALSGPRIWLLYVVLPLGEAFGMVFQVTYVTAVRNLVGVGRVTEANGRLNATAAAAGVLGPLCAGAVAARFGATAAVAINAVSFGVSAVGIRFVRLRGQGTGAGEGVPVRGKPWREFSAGARFLWRHPVLRSLTLLLSFFSFLTLGVTDVLIYHLKHDLGRSDGTVGTVLAVAAVGAVTGSLLVAPMRRRLGFGACWIGANAVGGLALAGLGAAGSVPVIAVLAAVYLAAFAVAGTCSMSLRQQVTPDALLGRVTSAFWTIQYSLGPVGAVVLTWLAARHGTGRTTLLIGACCVLIAVVALFTPIRRPHPERASPGVDVSH